MADRSTHTYPPLGDDARYDAIVSRGRTLRRRRRAGVGLAGASGVMAATVVVVVLFAATGTSGGEPTIADQGRTSTTTSTTVTTVPASDATTIQVLGDQLPAEVLVTDPAQPVPTGADEPAHQCILATLTDGTGASVGEAWACAQAADSDERSNEVPVPLVAPNGPQIGCAASAMRLDPVERATTSDTSTFRVDPPAGLAPGTYSLHIEAVSGIGDGCPGPSTPGSSEAENQAAPATAQVSVP